MRYPISNIAKYCLQRNSLEQIAHREHIIQYPEGLISGRPRVSVSSISHYRREGLSGNSPIASGNQYGSGSYHMGYAEYGNFLGGGTGMGFEMRITNDYALRRRPVGNNREANLRGYYWETLETLFESFDDMYP